jgi:tRNA (adenine22-N1)-methyltransferase
LRIKRLPGKRLEAVASFVGRGARLCDVGSDHAKLPIWLFNNEIISSAVITDINEAPLKRARAAIERAGFLSRSLFFCCDGLAGIDPRSFDTVVMAGMGGETIAGILSRAPWLKDGFSLILQPNSGQYELRAWLYSNNYAITEGRLAREGGRFYTIMTAKGDNFPQRPSEAELYAGSEFVLAKDALFCDYADYLIKGLELAVKGIGRAKGDHSGRAARLGGIIEGIRDMKAEVLNGRDSGDI